MPQYHVGILIFDGVEVLDFAGPYEVFSITRHSRVVIDGNVFTSGGVTAGIDLALAIVARLLGEPAARRAARRIEYFPPEMSARAKYDEPAGQGYPVV